MQFFFYYKKKVSRILLITIFFNIKNIFKKNLKLKNFHIFLLNKIFNLNFSFILIIS